MRTLEPNTIYRDCNGNDVAVMGPTKVSEHLMWALSGNWYCRYSGKFVHTNREGGYYLSVFPRNADLDRTVKGVKQ